MGEDKENTAAPEEETKGVEMIKKEYFSSATTHGIARIYEATNFYTRFIWILAFLAMFASLTYTVAAIIRKITSNDIVTTTRSESRIPMDFPSITVCNGWPFRKTELNKYLSIHAPSLVNASSEADLLKLTSMFSTMNTSIVQELGHLPGDFFLTTPSNMFNNLPCTYPTDFHLTVSPLHGNCYTFNYNGTLKQQMPGAYFGLSLNINVNEEEAHLSLLSSHVVGALVFINTPGVPANVGTSFVLAAPGHKTRIGLIHERVYRLPHPYPDKCTPKSTPVIGNIRYSFLSCYIKCFLVEQYKVCGSVDPTIVWFTKTGTGKLKDLDKFELANTTEKFKCTTLFYQNFLKGKVTCSCPAVCEDDIYRRTISSAKWPSKPFASVILKDLRQKSPQKYGNWTYDKILDNLVSIEIFFDNFAIFETKQNPAYDESSFVSDLGGAIGLWIGASVYSVLELMAFIGQLVFHSIHNSKLKKVKEAS